MPEPSRPVTDWSAVRSWFPGLDDKVFLDSACVSLAPRQAREAIAAFVENVTMLPTADATEHHIILDDGRQQARAEAARLVGARPEEIALVESTTHGLNLAACGLPLSGGENVVLCDLEYLGVAAPWAARARETGFDLRFVRHREGRIEMEDVARAVDDNTRAICLSTVLWTNGFRLDLAALSRLARERGTLLVLDVIQHLGAMRLDLRETPADIVVCGGHKWLNAPFGCGFAYVGPEALVRLRPLMWGYLNLLPPEGGWGRLFATPGLTPIRRYEFVETAQRFETGGTSNYPGAYGLAASLRLFNEVGPAAIEERIGSLTDRLDAALRDAGFRIVTPAGRKSRAGILTFTASGDPAADEKILAALRRRRVCISQRYTNRVGGLRASVHFFNNEADVDALVREARRARDEG